MTDGRNEDSEAPAISVLPAAGSTAAAADDKTPGASWHLRRTGIWVLAALVLALIVVGSLPYWAPPLVARLPWGTGPKHANEIAALKTQLSQSEQDRDTAQAQLAENQRQMAETASAGTPAPARKTTTPVPPVQATPAAAAAPAETALIDRVAAIERHLAAGDTAALAPIHQELGELEARLSVIETRLGKLASVQASRQGDADRTLLLAVAELRGTIASSRPYAGQLAAVTALAHDRPELAATLTALKATAASGIPSTAALAGLFTNEVAPAIMRAAAAGTTKNEGWGAAILARLKSLVVIRRIDSAGGGQATTDPVAAAVGNAQRTLDQGDLAGAVAMLAKLDGPAQAAAAPWLASARKRLAAQAALDRLTQLIAEHLAQAEGTAAAGPQ